MRFMNLWQKKTGQKQFGEKNSDFLIILLLKKLPYLPVVSRDNPGVSVSGIKHKSRNVIENML